MNEMNSAYHVLLQRGTPSHWQAVAEFASECAPKISRGLVTKACRFGNGLIRLMLTHDEAQLLAEKLHAAGFPALAVPLSAIVQPPQPYTLLRVDFTDDALQVFVGASTTAQTVPWSSIRLLHVSCVKIKNTPILNTLNTDSETDTVSLALTAAAISGVDPMMAYVASKQQVDAAERAAKESLSESAGGTEVVLELLMTNPLVRLRIRQSKFSYEFLGARRQPISRANFALLLTDIKSRATEAACAGLFPIALAGRRIEPEKYGVEEGENDQHLAALLTCENTMGLPR